VAGADRCAKKALKTLVLQIRSRRTEGGGGFEGGEKRRRAQPFEQFLLKARAPSGNCSGRPSRPRGNPKKGGRSRPQGQDRLSGNKNRGARLSREWDSRDSWGKRGIRPPTPQGSRTSAKTLANAYEKVPRDRGGGRNPSYSGWQTGSTTRSETGQTDAEGRRGRERRAKRRLVSEGILLR